MIVATPPVLMIGVVKGAEDDILIKGGEHTEIASKNNLVVFYNTETLTEGKQSVTDIITLDK